MDKLDKDTILKRNPQVDEELLREFEAAIREASKFLKKTELPVVPPYGGRRALSDEVSKQRARATLLERHLAD
ncbi:MAG: hypothetical protein WBD43_02515 [Methylovirgula sp.]